MLPAYQAKAEKPKNCQSWNSDRGQTTRASETEQSHIQNQELKNARPHTPTSSGQIMSSRKQAEAEP
jgi:hypothetical protein